MNSTLIILILIVPIAGAFIWWQRKKKKSQANNSSSLDNRNINPNEKKDEVWRTIKEFLRENNQKGLEIISSYSIRRPSMKDLHDRLKEAVIYEAKQKSKINKTKYIKPKIPKKFQIEEYFQNLNKETYELSKGVSDEPITAGTLVFDKTHRKDMIEKAKKAKAYKAWYKTVKSKFDSLLNKTLFKSKNASGLQLDNRELYVLLFKTRNSRTKEIYETRAIEVEILKEKLDSKNTKRKIVINTELDLQKEMSWIKPIKDNDDKAAIKEEEARLKREQKATKVQEKRENNELWYQKVIPQPVLKKLKLSGEESKKRAIKKKRNKIQNKAR